MVDNWKKQYIINGNAVTVSRYCSIYGTHRGSNGTRQNPAPSIIGTGGNTVMGNGRFSLVSQLSSSSKLIGNGMFNTTVDIQVDKLAFNGEFKDFTIDYAEEPLLWDGAGKYNLCLKRNISFSGSFAPQFYNSLFLGVSIVQASASSYANPNNTFVSVYLDTIGGKSPLISTGFRQTVFHDCDIQVTAAFSSTFKAFNDCRFKIGLETSYTPLTGTTQVELRANFVARCTAQGINQTNEDKFVFSTNDLDVLYVPKINGVINTVSNAWGVYMGYVEARESQILIQELINDTSGFCNNEGITNGLEIRGNIIGVKDDADISNKLTKQSMMIAFPTIRSIVGIDIISNLPASVIASTVNNLREQAITDTINNGINYLVASSDTGVASVEYNGQTYLSDKTANMYIFRGVDGIEAITASGNAIIYRILDYVNMPSIGLRVVETPLRTLSTGQVALKKGYWYYVVNATDVAVNGSNYSTGSSFLAQSNTTITLNGVIAELCEDDETKNPFIDMFITKPTIAMSNFKEPKIGSDGVPVGSSHVEYESSIAGGYMEGYLRGRFIQLKIGINAGN